MILNLLLEPPQYRYCPAQVKPHSIEIEEFKQTIKWLFAWTDGASDGNKLHIAYITMIIIRHNRERDRAGLSYDIREETT